MFTLELYYHFFSFSLFISNLKLVKVLKVDLRQPPLQINSNKSPSKPNPFRGSASLFGPLTVIKRKLRVGE